MGVYTGKIVNRYLDFPQLACFAATMGFLVRPINAWNEQFM
jgi:hypothetical protein